MKIFPLTSFKTQNQKLPGISCNSYSSNINNIDSQKSINFSATTGEINDAAEDAFLLVANMTNTSEGRTNFLNFLKKHHEVFPSEFTAKLENIFEQYSGFAKKTEVAPK